MPTFTPILDEPHPLGRGGRQKVYRFGNGYGASVVTFPEAYGWEQDKWELAVIRFVGEEFRIDDSTPITGNVIGWLSLDEVEELLEKINALPEPEQCQPSVSA